MVYFVSYRPASPMFEHSRVKQRIASLKTKRMKPSSAEGFILCVGPPDEQSLKLSDAQAVGLRK